MKKIPIKRWKIICFPSSAHSSKQNLQLLKRLYPHLQIKRPWLVEQAVQNAGLELKLAHGHHNSYVTMAGYYPTVDALIVASTEEGAGLPALEASAAGRLVISTPVGLWKSQSGNSGHTVPIDERRFVEETTALLEFYRDNTDAYLQKCVSTQQHARR